MPTKREPPLSTPCSAISIRRAATHQVAQQTGRPVPLSLQTRAPQKRQAGSEQEGKTAVVDHNVPLRYRRKFHYPACACKSEPFPHLLSGGNGYFRLAQAVTVTVSEGNSNGIQIYCSF